MKICIPVQTSEGNDSRVSGHFGSAPFFALYDTEKGIEEILDNGARAHGHGQCAPMYFLADRGIHAVLCSGMGMRAVDNLNRIGIRAYRFVTDVTSLADAVEAYNGKKYEEMNVNNACAHHGHGCH